MKRLNSILAALLIAGTTLFAQESKTVTKDKTMSSAVAPKLDWQGTYFGITNCANCDGIETKLVLQKGNKYILSLNATNSRQKEFTQQGTFTWQDSMIILKGVKDATASRYKVEANQVKQLYLIDHKIQGEDWTGYTLKKLSSIAFEEKRWQLIELNHKPVEGSPETHYIIFDSKSGLMTTKVGCNLVRNDYKLRNKIQIKWALSIYARSPCPEGNIEEEFLDTLLSADHISVDGDILSFNKGQKRNLIKFRLVPE